MLREGVGMATRLITLSAGEPPTLGQIARGVNTIGERIAKMAEQLDRLNAAVDQELADDAAQNELIAELRVQLAAAQDAASQAGVLEGQLAEALSAAEAAAVRLESNDVVADDGGVDVPVEDDQPAEGEQPEQEV